jgi:primosomal protein N' (replication factor Y)
VSDAYARVVVQGPLYSMFDYRVAPDAPVAVGCRVRVPFGRGMAVAIVVELPADIDCEPSQLKSIAERIDAVPILDGSDIALQLWVARYYHSPPGEAVFAALPVRLRRGLLATLPGADGWRLTPSGAAQLAIGEGRAPRRQAMLRALADAPRQRLARDSLRKRFPSSKSTLRSLQQNGWIEPVRMAPEPDPDPDARPGGSLHDAQQAAVDAVAATFGGFAVALLDGVTGSGKTEVYLDLVALALAHGDSALVLVPEISLTPQLARRFQQRFGDTVRVMHSGIAEQAREQTWHRLRLGLSRVLLGTRSSVFTPLPRLGLVIVDEEHDTSFKQTDGLRYSARDLAVVRAQRASCPVVLGSATPSFESLRHALDGRYRHLRLDRRAAGAAPPAIELLDIRDQPLQAGLAQPLLARVQGTLDAGQQVILFLNRRGFAPVLCCYACGWISDCPQCDARQVVHRGVAQLACHHCGAHRRLPRACPDCGAPELHPLGQGTEQLEDYLAERFAGFPLIRIDRDATARKGSLEAKLAQVHEGGAALLVGTQMLAKGHHFPAVTLVGVVDADAGLYSADFRATERLAQLLAQVAGRAGRGDRPGRVLIQTRFPDHPLLQTLVRDGYRHFASRALTERRAAGLPPYSYQALLRAEARDMAGAQAFLGRAVDSLSAAARDGVELWGPVPAPMARRAGRYRAQLLLQSPTRESLHGLLVGLPHWLARSPGAGRVRWSLDIDPCDLY